MDLHLRKTLYYLILAFFLSWGLFYAYFFFGGTWESPWTAVMMTAYMIMPAVSAWLVQKILFNEPMKNLGLFLYWDKWYWVSLILPILVAVGAFGVGFLFKDVHYSAEMQGMFDRLEGRLSEEEMMKMKEMTKDFPIPPFWMMLGQALIAGITINALFAFGEELGWRGMLYRQLIRYGFWFSSFFTGLVWGIWHLPAVLMGHNYPDHPVKGVFFMIVFCMLWSPIFQLIRLKTGSVFPVSVLHGTINAGTGLAILHLEGGTDLTVGITGISGIIVLGVVNLLLLFYDKQKPIIPPRETS